MGRVGRASISFSKAGPRPAGAPLSLEISREHDDFARCRQSAMRLLSPSRRRQQRRYATQESAGLLGKRGGGGRPRGTEQEERGQRKNLLWPYRVRARKDRVKRWNTLTRTLRHKEILVGLQ